MKEKDIWAKKCLRCGKILTGNRKKKQTLLCRFCYHKIWRKKKDKKDCWDNEYKMKANFKY